MRVVIHKWWTFQLYLFKDRILIETGYHKGEGFKLVEIIVLEPIDHLINLVSVQFGKFAFGICWVRKEPSKMYFLSIKKLEEALLGWKRKHQEYDDGYPKDKKEWEL